MQLAAIIVSAFAIITAETLLLFLFRMRSKDIISWEEPDTPFSRTIRARRMDLFAVLHTIILLIVVEGFLLAAW